MSLLRLLMRQGRAGHVMDNDLVPLDTPANVRRLRGIPFYLFVGSDNKVLSPAATERTYSVLRETFGDDGFGGVVGRDEAAKVGGGEGAAEGELADNQGSGAHATNGHAGNGHAETTTTPNDNAPSPSPTSTSTTANCLDPEMMYRRRVIPGYGHLDTFLGRDAWRDVFPYVREEADRVVRGRDYRFEEPRDRFYGMVSGGSGL